MANLVDEAPEMFKPMEMCLYKESEFVTLANESKTRVFVGLSAAEHVREAIQQLVSSVDSVIQKTTGRPRDVFYSQP